MTQIITGLFDQHESAAAAIRGLSKGLFSDREITVVAKADEEAMRLHEEAATKRDVKSGVWSGSALGAAVGGYLGLLSMVLIPALPLFVVGGAVVGGLAGTMTSLGVAQKDTRETEEVLRAGGALVVVRVEDEQRARAALEQLEKAGARSAGIVEPPQLSATPA